MKGRSPILLFLAILFAAAALYFFFFTERNDGLILEGIVDANQVVVSPKVQGILERLNVDEGSSVRAGELIATLDTAELDAEMRANRATVENLQAQLAQARSNYQMALTETTGDLAGATALVNQIRTRAGVFAQGPGTDRASMAIPINDPRITWASYKIGLYPVFPDAASARNAVQTERRLELAMEGQRFFDLRRYGTVAAVINGYINGVGGGAENTRILYKKFAEPIIARHRFYAIPNIQIQLSKTGATENLKQNPGW